MRIKEGYKIRNIAGEHVIISIGTLNVNLTQVTSLNATSVWLWEQLAGTEFDAERVTDLLTERYDVDRQTARTDAEAWLELLRKAELVRE